MVTHAVLVDSLLSLSRDCSKTWVGRCASGMATCGTSDVAGHKKLHGNGNSSEGLGGSVWLVQEQSNSVKMVKLIRVYFCK